MEVTAIWFGGEIKITGDSLSVRSVLDDLNRTHPTAKYFKARNEKGELLKPTVQLTNNQRVFVLQDPLERQVEN